MGRHRDRRGSDHGKPSGSQDAEFRRYPHDRAFPRFEHFESPFRQYFDEDVPDFYEAGYRPAPEHQPQYTYSTQQPSAEESQQQQQQSQPQQPVSPQPSSAERPPHPPGNREGSRKQNIQQSNTVDLGQKQEPVDENRGQRSMSAPPENRSTGQRFVSSINIPIQKPSCGGGNMGAKTSTQAQETRPQQQQQSNKPNERVIPIHVEGRDEPIIPKNVNATYTQPPPQPHSQPHPHPQPQPEKIFGQKPAHFTQYLNKGEPHGMTPEEIYRQQQQQYQQKQQQNFQQQQAQQQNQPQEQSQAPQQDQAPTQQPPPPSKPNQLEQIQIIQKDVSELMNQVEKFNGKPRDRQYLYLDEMLTRNLIKLDTIETEGKDNIRQARKEAIKCIEGCIGILEAKANANLAAEMQTENQKMEVVQESEKPQEEAQPVASTEQVTEMASATSENEQAALEVSGVTRTGSAVSVTPMEVTAAEDSGKEVPVSAQSEADMQSKSEASTDIQQKSEEVKAAEIKVEENNKENAQTADESKKEESMVADNSEKKVDASIETSSQSLDNPTAASSEDKKEKKKGKKKPEKADKN